MAKRTNEQDMNKLKLPESDQKLLDQFIKFQNGEANEAPKLQDFLASPSATILIPKTIIMAARTAAEPVYVASKFFKRVRMPNSGALYVFPTFGPMRAFDIAEAQEYPTQTIEGELFEGVEIRIGKSGLRLQFTEEVIQDSQWDVIAMMLEQAGRAMARHKEQKAFRQFSMHGWPVFDNDPAIKTQSGGLSATTGLDVDGNYNDTFSVEDFLDLIIAVMLNEFDPNTILMHPLTWITFAKQELMNSVMGGMNLYPATDQPGSMKLGPNSLQGRIPFAFDLMLSPQIPINMQTRRYDMYCIDRNNIGVLLEKEGLSTEKFNDPTRDIFNVKLKEKYGFGVFHEGRAIAVAKNIKLDVAYLQPKMIRVHGVVKTEDVTPQ